IGIINLCYERRATRDEENPCPLSLVPVLYLQVLLTRLPVGCAKAAGLQSLQNTKRLINRTSDIQIVNNGVLQNAVGVDDEQSAKRDVGFFDEDVVFRRETAAY